MIKLKNNKGITLVALIITIIVLLILAMVSIALVMNSGIITKSKTAVDKYSQEEIQEQIKLAYSEWQMHQYTNETQKTAPVFMQEKLRDTLKDNELIVTGSNGVFVVKISNNEQYIYDATSGKMLEEFPISAYPTATAGTETTENSKYTSDGKTAVIPAGYTVSSEDTEQSIDNGLVIIKDGNEWVWIPVSSSDLEAMYTEDATGWTMDGTEVVTKYKTTGTQSRGNPGDASNLREPDVLNNDSYDKNAARLSSAGLGENIEEAAIKLKDDYKAMINSVKKYGGFYVGRYELSNAGTKKNQVSVTTLYWYNVYKKCRDIESSSDTVVSTMIFGCQWDQVCKFISTAKVNGETISLTDSRKYGNYSNSQESATTGNYSLGRYGVANKRNTGSNEAWKTNNIYDLAGNCVEFTQEASGDSGRVTRGGGISDKGDQYSVISRTAYNAAIDRTNLSSRPVLYIK